MYLFARNEEANRWLEEHPAVLGAIFLVLGFTLLSFGVKALLTGRSTGKYGHEFEGASAYLHGAMLTIAGGGCVLFALYKLVTGLR